MNYSVSFNEHFKSSVNKRRGDACFSSIYDSWNSGKKKPTHIFYAATVREKMEREDIERYIQFLKKILLPNSFRYRINDNGSKVFFILDAREMRRSVALLHLTAFRYLDEFHVVLGPFMKALPKGEYDTDKIFRLFVAYNYFYYRNCYNMGGHGLVYPEYGTSYPAKTKKNIVAWSAGAIGFEEFHKRLTSNNYPTVQSHFFLNKPEATSTETHEKDE